MSLMGEGHGVVEVNRIHDIQIVQGAKARQGIGALPVHGANDNCGAWKQLTDKCGKLFDFNLPSVGIKIGLIEQLGEDPICRMTSHDLSQISPGILQLLHRRGRLLAVQPIEPISGMQVDRYVIAEGYQLCQSAVDCVQPVVQLCFRSKPLHDVFCRYRQANMGHAGFAQLQKQPVGWWSGLRAVDPAVGIEAAG